MRISYIFVSILMVLGLCSCLSSSDSPDVSGDTVELSLNKSVSGSISVLGDVDWYHYKAVEANSMLQVAVSSNTYRPDVDLLVSAYEEDEDGNRVRILGAHAPEDSQLPADIKLNLIIDKPKDIYIAVRDLMDDDKSDNLYYISLNFAGSTEENNNFDQAIAVTVDDASSCQDDDIGYVGDVDVYKFDAPANGVYAVSIDFTPFPGGTDVELSIDLYNSDGTQVQSLLKPQGYNYDLVSYLNAGQYFVLIDDYGRDDFDTASPYKICVESRASNEQNENDVIGNASSMAYDPATQTFTVNGSIDYWDDQDWYELPLDTIGTGGFKVLQISFDDEEGNTDLNFDLHLEDTQKTVLLSHDFTAGSSEYLTQIKAGDGAHYLLIKPAQNQTFSENVSYTISVEVLDIQDPAETVEKAQGVGNDTVDTADVLTPSANPNDATTGKIAYRGDEDWYSVTINDTSQPQVLEVFLDTDSQPSYVDYYLSVMRDGVVAKKYDTSGEDGGTELKTSILVPATSQSPVMYLFRVCDYQGDDGDGETPYRIRANVNSIPGGLPADSTVNPASAYYYSEAAEIGDGTAETIKLEHTSLTQKAYAANTSLLDFNVLNPANGITKTENGDSTTTVTFPWVAGYIDFEGDQDWFKIDFGPLVDDPNDAWYYDIQIDFHVDAPGSSTEYVWKLYRDRNGNQILVDRRNDSNGFFASAGDPDTTAQALDITTPAPGDGDFWVGNRWEGSFYLSTSDFNYVGSDYPDDDWGYDVPYYFRLTLTYHPGVSNP